MFGNQHYIPHRTEWWGKILPTRARKEELPMGMKPILGGSLLLLILGGITAVLIKQRKDR